ncbi:aspartate-alanine antiporter [Silvimonas amylolytica]|uniref:Aspartate-alanine antiporter n=1 Tax=Silvimonas amylolytica TaxID=449663 RepID=A0ABQ2PI09_9NEIS|nr:aspartate-alanine antiporter [Silvimonas amylolytica]GGP24876.1 aspartate-alanine antiporter [Silvimonas amylolytica]
MDWLHDIFKHAPEIALFFSLAVGYRIGQIHFGKFQLGGVAGSLLVAVVVSQVGVSVDPGVKAVLFALFIYAVGYESGPSFFSSLGRQSIREIILAAVLSITGLLTVVICAKIFALDKGLAAGIAAGGLTQSAIIGTAGDAITKLGLGADEVKRLQANVAIGYAVTYVFGSFGAIIVCVNMLPKLMGRSIREDAIAAEASQQAGVHVLGPGQVAAAPALVGRLYQVGPAAGRQVSEIEQSSEPPITLEKLKRDGKVIDIAADTQLQQGDIVLVVGRRTAVLEQAPRLGTEIHGEEGMDLVVQARELVVTSQQLIGKSLKEIAEQTSPVVRHGVYLTAVSRMGKPLPMGPDTRIERGDTVQIYGAERDINRVAGLIGYMVVQSDKTDFVYMGAGLVVGLLIGLIVVKLGSIPLTLGSGGGALLSGLLFGWYRAKKQNFGLIPTGAVQLLKDLGLAGFVVVVGLSSGLQAVETIKAQGMSIFLIGVVVTMLPMILTMLFGRYVLRYDNVAVFAGALSGSRSANPAFGEILTKAENAVPTVPFAITYALANVFLTLLGPLIVALV